MAKISKRRGEMKKTNFNLAVWGAVFVIIVGTVWHFVYGWSGRSVAAGVFAPVNESVWEHMKLALTPLFLLGIVDFFVLRKKSKNFFYVKAIEFYLVVVLMISSFYTYAGIIGRNFLPVDIATFVVSVVVGKIVSYRLLMKETKKPVVVSVALLVLLAAMFAIFTFHPPRIALFKDSRDNTYGIYKTR